MIYAQNLESGSLGNWLSKVRCRLPLLALRISNTLGSSGKSEVDQKNWARRTTTGQRAGAESRLRSWEFDGVWCLSKSAKVHPFSIFMLACMYNFKYIFACKIKLPAHFNKMFWNFFVKLNQYYKLVIYIYIMHRVNGMLYCSRTNIEMNLKE